MIEKRKKSELIDVLADMYGKDIVKLYEEAVQNHPQKNKYTQNRISQKILDCIDAGPKESILSEIILDSAPFVLEEMPDGYSLKQRTENEMLDYIQKDATGVTNNGNHNALYDGVNHGRIKYLNDDRSNAYLSHDGICFSIMEGDKIVGNRMLREHHQIDNFIGSAYISVDKDYQNQGFSKHLLYESMKWCADQGYVYFQIGSIKPEGRGYVLHNYKKLSTLYPKIRFVKRAGSEGFIDMSTGAPLFDGDI